MTGFLLIKLSPLRQAAIPWLATALMYHVSMYSTLFYKVINETLNVLSIPLHCGNINKIPFLKGSSFLSKNTFTWPSETQCPQLQSHTCDHSHTSACGGWKDMVWGRKFQLLRTQAGQGEVALEHGRHLRSRCSRPAELLQHLIISRKIWKRSSSQSPTTCSLGQTLIQNTFPFRTMGSKQKP